MARTASDVPVIGKRLDGRKNYLTVLRRLPRGFVYASPEEALQGWKLNACYAGDKLLKIVRRSLRAGMPVCVNILQREQSPDGREVNVAILTVDLRVTPMPE